MENYNESYYQGVLAAMELCHENIMIECDNCPVPGCGGDPVGSYNTDCGHLIMEYIKEYEDAC